MWWRENMTTLGRIEFELDSGPRVIVRDMLTITRATDLFIGDCIRRGYSDRTVATYQRRLYKFNDTLRPDTDVGEVVADDCRAFLDDDNGKSAGTRAHSYSVLSSFFKWLYRTEKIKRNPMERLERPRRIPPEDLDVTTVSPDDVKKLLEVATGWTERLTIGIACYLGPRRAALAQIKLSDYDQVRSRIRFREKGGKTIWKPVPVKLGHLIQAAITDPEVYKNGPDSYLIPAEGGLSRTGPRDDRVIWRVVKRVADRAGVDAHVHSLRAAFACFYLEQNPGDIVGLKDLLGHRSFATTQVYLRKYEKEAAMEPVRTLDWGDNATPNRNPADSGKTVGVLAFNGGGRI